MHFSIPDTSELTDHKTGSTFIAFNIHANGSFHCHLRYRQLNQFYETLKKRFGNTSLPYFPPKKYFPMNVVQTEERRSHLEKFIQIVSQNSKISSSDTFNTFFLNAQIDSYLSKLTVDAKLMVDDKIELVINLVTIKDKVVSNHDESKVMMDAIEEIRISDTDDFSDPLSCDRRPFSPLSTVPISNGRSHADNGSNSVKVNICPGDKTSIVLENVLNTLKVDIKYMPYFSLYVRCNDRHIDAPSSAGQFNGVSNHKSCFKLIRRLQNFEAPYLTLKTLNNGTTTRSATTPSHDIVIRTSYWDANYDNDLFSDFNALKLVYKQTQSDIETYSSTYLEVSKEVRHQLKSFDKKISSGKGDQVKETASMISYLTLARTLKYYNYLHFDDCLVNYPDKDQDSNCILSVGGKELVVRIVPNKMIDALTDKHVDHDNEYMFRVTRIRCWRLTSSGNTGNRIQSDNLQTPKYELSFEYLMSSNNVKTDLRWITIKSKESEVILISMSLQSMVEELIYHRRRSSLTSSSMSSNCGPVDNLNVSLLTSSISSMTNSGSSSVLSRSTNNSINNHHSLASSSPISKSASNTSMATSSSCSTLSNSSLATSGMVNGSSKVNGQGANDVNHGSHPLAINGADDSVRFNVKSKAMVTKRALQVSTNNDSFDYDGIGDDDL